MESTGGYRILSFLIVLLNRVANKGGPYYKIYSKRYYGYFFGGGGWWNNGWRVY